MKPIIGVSADCNLFPNDLPASLQSVVLNYWLETSLINSADKNVFNCVKDEILRELLRISTPKVDKERSIPFDAEVTSSKCLKNGLSDFLVSNEFKEALRRTKTLDTSSSKDIVHIALRPYLLLSNEMIVIDRYLLLNLANRIYLKKKVYVVEEILKVFPGKLKFIVPEPNDAILKKDNQKDPINNPFTSKRELIREVLNWFRGQLDSKECLTSSVEIELQEWKTRVSVAESEAIKFPHDRIVKFIYKSQNNQQYPWYFVLGKGLDSYFDEETLEMPTISRLENEIGKNHLKNLNWVKKFQDSNWREKYGFKLGENVISRNPPVE